MKILFSGADQATLDKIADHARIQLSKLNGLSVDGKVDLTNGIPKYKITFNQETILKNGIQMTDILKVTNRYMSQPKDATFVVDHMSLPADMYLDQISSNSSQVKVDVTPADVMASLKNETVQGKDGQPIRFDQFTTISKDQSASTISERNGQPYSFVTAQITSVDISKVSKQINQLLSKMKLPKDVTYSMGGIVAQVKGMIIDMAIAVGFCILLVLMITSTLFKG